MTPPAAVRISVATPAEAPIVHGLMLTAFREYEGVLEVPSSALSETVTDCAAAMSRGGAVLAWRGGEPVGSARYQLRDTYAYFERISVLPEHRGRGLATALLAEMERLAARAGHVEGRLSVRLALPKNLALYTRLGYEVYAQHPHPKGTELIADLKKRFAADVSNEPLR
ncbi:MAG: GNAT family N-acetyltransferase [Anaerolinea sp.]|nr:GNAT family N-acetyltransferase [Anaerolinea sp.]